MKIPTLEEWFEETLIYLRVGDALSSVDVPKRVYLTRVGIDRKHNCCKAKSENREDQWDRVLVAYQENLFLYEAVPW